MNLPAPNQQHVLVDPAEEEDLGERVRQRLVPEVPHVDGFEVGEHLVAGVMEHRWWWWWW